MDDLSTQNQERSLGRLEGKVDSIVNMMQGMQGEVTSLRNDFGTMEKGRLSRLEVQFATISTEVGVKARSQAIWASATISLSIAIVAAVAAALLRLYVA